MADVLIKFVLICAVLGAFWSALASSGVGRMRQRDVLELRRQQHFKYVLARNANAPWLSHQEVPAVAAPVRGPAGSAACAACGALSGWEGSVPG